MKVKFHYGKLDLTDTSGIDMVICPSDRDLSGSGGLDGLIHHAAGAALEKELAALRPIETGKAVTTSGGDLPVKHIVHAAVPAHSEDITVLVKCYSAILWEAGRFDRRENVAITLIGTGVCGWSVQESMQALWTAVLDYQREHGSPYFGFANIEQLTLYYPKEAHQTVYPYTRRRSQAFFTVPGQWGARGDPHFWYDLMFHFDDPAFDKLTLREFVHEIQRYFHWKSGEWLSEQTKLYLEEYAHGGMSSGYISGFMAQIGIPLLCHNLVELELEGTDKGRFIVLVELHSFHPVKYPLRLPYDLLEELEFLRTPSHSMNEKIRIALDEKNLYFLSIYHYKGNSLLIDRYVLDVEAAFDSHYEFDEKGCKAICKPMGYLPSAIGNALRKYLENNGGAALESLVKSVCTKQYHYD